MRFEGSHTFDLPVEKIWVALRDPDVLQIIIPNCTRIERQPGHHPEGTNDFTLGFELGKADITTGNEPIVGWLEIDRQIPHKRMGVTVTLNDSLTLLRAEGSISLHEREHGQKTELHYHLNVHFPEINSIGWSAQAYSVAQTYMGGMLQAMPEAIDAAQAAHAGVHKNGTHTLRTDLGHITLMSPHEVPGPTQGMLRRIDDLEERRQARHVQQVAIIVGIGVVGGLALASGILSFFRHDQQSS